MTNNLIKLLLLLAIVSSCSKIDNVSQEEKIEINGNEVNVTSLEQGIVRLQLSQEFGGNIESITKGNGQVDTKSTYLIDNTFQTMGVVRMERTFPYAGEFEERTRESGLHLWYDVYFDPNISLTRASVDFSTIEGVENVELLPKIISAKTTVVPFGKYSFTSNTDSSDSTDKSIHPFNDPMLEDQWHYYNAGSGSKYLAGADINVYPVWRDYSPGDENIIVGVVDGGIDYNHEDLKENMWINPNQTGQLVYGYNFVSNGYQIVPHTHGTHVAGTIGAVNNNGIGVSGVAGGNFEKGIKGVKLMSCQIFQGEGDDETGVAGGGAKAIKWSADNGAIISQNSWGYEEYFELPDSDKDAIDYFIKYAGKDANGNQVAPMSGGVVIFSAGNYNRDVATIQEYEPVISVTAIAADYTRAYYSNFGDWNDIAAPGGDYYKGPMVLSTYPGNEYEAIQGTSMACPHVSGVAALIIAEHGGPGFTNEMLKERLLSTTRNISSYNPGVELGRGLVDAYAAVASGGKIAPEKILDFRAEAESNTISFQLTIPKDEDNVRPYGINVYYSKEPITDLSKASFKSVKVDQYNVGDLLTGVIEEVEFSTKYYLAATAFDVSGNASELSNIQEVTIVANNPPVIEVVSGTEFQLRAHQYVYADFLISDPDGHLLSMEFTSNTNAINATLLGDRTKVQVLLEGDKDVAGEYSATLKIIDKYGEATSVIIKLTILPNSPPTLIKNIEDIYLKSTDEVATYKIAEYFEDLDEEALKISAEYSVNGVCIISSTSENFQIHARKEGLTQVTLSATDALNNVVQTTFNVFVANPADEMVNIYTYPNPVIDKLNIRGEEDMESATVELFNLSGTKVYSEKKSITPFTPLEIDMSHLSGGSYTVVVTSGESVVKRKIVKL